jgi:hypothetical protein
MGGRASSHSDGTMPLYLRKSELRRVGEWFLAVRAKANSWMLLWVSWLLVERYYVKFYTFMVAFVQEKGKLICDRYVM